MTLFWCLYFFIVNFEYIFYLVLIYLLLTCAHQFEPEKSFTNTLLSEYFLKFTIRNMSCVLKQLQQTNIRLFRLDVFILSWNTFKSTFFRYQRPFNCLKNWEHFLTRPHIFCKKLAGKINKFEKQSSRRVL